jgi:threonine dehydrogenase-like Zn-dependent dehydrogenase
MASTRRHFLQASGAAGLALPAALAQQAASSPNDRIQFATIGCGIMGQGDTGTAISVPGTKLVAVCDVYEGRLTRAKEHWGQDIFTTRDHREVSPAKTSTP